MHIYRDHGKFSFGRGFFKIMRRSPMGTSVEETWKIKRSTQDANAHQSEDVSRIIYIKFWLLAQFQQSIHIHYWAFTQLVLPKRHCAAHNEECDEEMNTESIAKLNQAGEGKTKTKDIKGIDVMHVGGPEALNHN